MAGFSGCVRMRDYTGVKSGAFCLLKENRFGEGGENKDYHVISDELYIIRGDTNNEIIARIGLPDSREASGKAGETWLYKDRNLKLYFENDRLRSWEVIPTKN